MKASSTTQEGNPECITIPWPQRGELNSIEQSWVKITQETAPKAILVGASFTSWAVTKWNREINQECREAARRWPRQEGPKDLLLNHDDLRACAIGIMCNWHKLEVLDSYEQCMNAVKRDFHHWLLNRDMPWGVRAKVEEWMPPGEVPANMRRELADGLVAWWLTLGREQVADKPNLPSRLLPLIGLSVDVALRCLVSWLTWTRIHADRV